MSISSVSVVDPTISSPSAEKNTSSSSLNNNNNINNEDENIQNGFYSIACLNCRKSHRSCNKQYPACSDCVERGQECVYNCPKKKGRKKGSRNQKTTCSEAAPSVALQNTSTSADVHANNKGSSPSNVVATSASSRKSKNRTPTSSSSSGSSSSGAGAGGATDDYTQLLEMIKGNHPSPSSASSNSSTNQLIRRIYQPYIRMQQHFVNNSLRKRTVDMFFEVVGMGYDIISRPKLEQLAFDYMDDNIDEDGIFAKNTGFQVSATRSSAKAMLFAMQAMGEQRMGNAELSQKSYMEARNQLTQSFDNIDNTYVKIAYGLLACYMAGEGDDTTAHFYLNSLKHALERPETDNGYLLLETGDIRTPERQAKHFQTFMLKQKVCLDHNNPQDLNIWEGFISMYTAKTHENPPMAVQEAIRRKPSPQLLAVIDLIISVMNNSSKLHHFTENQRRVSSLYTTMMNNSAKIAVLLTLGIQGGVLLDNLADSVTALTDSDLFLLLPCSAIHYFAISMNYRLKQFLFVQAVIKHKLDTGRSLFSIFNDSYEKNYFDMVLKDMKALTRLNTRFKRVEKFYGSLISNLKAIIQWKSERTVEIIQNIGFISDSIGDQNQYNPSPRMSTNDHEPFTSAFGSSYTSNPSNHSAYSFIPSQTTPTVSHGEQQALLDSLDDLLGSNNDEFLNFDISDFTTN